jgi:hypothetical protein
MIYTWHISYSCGGFNPLPIELIGTTLSFFMSWFFFKGGMMHKKSTTKELFRKSVKRLLLPYVIFLFIGLLLECVIKFTSIEDLTIPSFLKAEISNFISTSIIWPTAASWFLLSLFVARIAFNCLYTKVHPLLITASFAFAAYGIFLMTNHSWTLGLHMPGHNTVLNIPTFYMGNMCHGLAVYSLGYYIKDRQFNKAIFLFALILFVLKYFIPASIDFRANTPSGVNFMLAVIYGMSGCIVINNIFKRFANKRISIISHIGGNSMVYYLIHYPVMYTTISLFWKPFEDSELWLRFIVLSSIVTISLVFADLLFRCEKLRFIIGG